MARSNRRTTLKPCAARASATTDTYDLDIDGRPGVIVYVKVTTASGFSMTPTLLGVDEQGDTYTILAGAAITAAGNARLQAGLAVPVTANLSANAVLPAKVRVSITHTDATSVIYSVTAEVAGS